MHELHTDIEIAASPADVWAVLVDFAAYSGWNPFIRYIQGNAKPGAPLKVGVRPPGARRSRMSATVLVADQPHELRCRACFLLPEVFEAELRLTLEPLPGGEARVAQSLAISGALAPLFRSRVDRNVQRGLREMNSALKGRVERGLAGAAPPPDASQALEVPTLKEVLLPEDAPAEPVAASDVEPQVRRRTAR